MARLGELDFEERFIPTENRRYVYGQTDYEGVIYVNPVPHIVATILHECLHEQFPHYAEHAVCSLTGKLMRQLSDEDLKAIYAEFKRNVDGD